MRARGASSLARFPLTSAITLSDLSEDSKPNNRKVPYSSVGRLVSATFVAFMRTEIISRRCGGLVLQHDVVFCAFSPVGSWRNQAKTPGPGHLINDRMSPPILAHQ